MLNLKMWGCIAVVALMATRVDADPSTSKQEIARFYDDFQKVLSSDSFMSDPTPALPFFDEKRIRLFDLGTPAEFDSKTFREHFIATSKMIPSKVTFEDIQIYADGGNVAFASLIQHTVGQMGGRTFDIRIRAVDGLEKSHGKWRIVNENLSLPLDDETLGQVIFGAKAK